jgi:hypothetical protein
MWQDFEEPKKFLFVPSFSLDYSFFFFLFAQIRL